MMVKPGDRVIVDCPGACDNECIGTVTFSKNAIGPLVLITDATEHARRWGIETGSVLDYPEYLLKVLSAGGLDLYDGVLAELTFNV